MGLFQPDNDIDLERDNDAWDYIPNGNPSVWIHEKENADFLAHRPSNAPLEQAGHLPGVEIVSGEAPSRIALFGDPHWVGKRADTPPDEPRRRPDSTTRHPLGMTTDEWHYPDGTSEIRSTGGYLCLDRFDSQGKRDLFVFIRGGYLSIDRGDGTSMVYERFGDTFRFQFQQPDGSRREEAISQSEYNNQLNFYRRLIMR